MSDMKQIMKQLRKYEIRVRKAINTQMQGDFHSVFKGAGLEFDDVRTYQYGDDIRHINWNVSAKGHGTFVKTFKEEKEQNIFFILDVSASMQVAQKSYISKLICGVLALSAIKESSAVGLLCFSNEKEKYVRPNKGVKHAYEVINALFKHQPKSTKTDLNAALALSLSTLKRKSVIVLVSDFLNDDYDRNLKALSRKHDLVVIHIADAQELELLKVGIAPVYFKESNRNISINTSSTRTREKMINYYNEKKKSLRQLCQRNNANYLYIDTQKEEEVAPALINLFKIRNRSRK